MESEFLKDLKDLSAAFEMHIKEDEDQRSIIVIGTDKSKVFTQVCGTGMTLMEGLASFLMNESDKDWLRFAVGYYQKEHLLSKKERKFGWFSLVMMFVVLFGLAIVCSLWLLGVLATIEAISNIAFLIYVVIYICWTNWGIWKKMARGRQHRTSGANETNLTK